MERCDGTPVTLCAIIEILYVAVVFMWQHFHQKSFTGEDYFGCADDLFGKFLLFKNYLSHSSSHSKRGFPAENRAKHAGCRRRLWQNRNTKSNMV